MCVCVLVFRGLLWHVSFNLEIILIVAAFRCTSAENCEIIKRKKKHICSFRHLPRNCSIQEHELDEEKQSSELSERANAIKHTKTTTQPKNI